MNNKGFTMVELLVAMAIMGLLYFDSEGHCQKGNNLDGTGYNYTYCGNL